MAWMLEGAGVGLVGIKERGRGVTVGRKYS